MIRLKTRAQYLRAAKKGEKVETPFFILQVYFDPAQSQPCFGFTVTKKVGNAVVRNRIKRRLKALVEHKAFPNGDYVFVGRKAALSCPYGDLVNALEEAYQKKCAS